jgi:predicted nucleic acid-binding protein
VSIAYLDSSALVKHYIAEVGSDWVKSLLALDRTPTVFTSNMTVVEATCAFPAGDGRGRCRLKITTKC